MLCLPSVARAKKKTVSAAVTPEDHAILKRMEAETGGLMSLAALSGTLLHFALEQGPEMLGRRLREASDRQE